MAAKDVTLARLDPPRAARRRWVSLWLLLAAICAAAVWYVVAVFVPQERAAAIELWRGRLSAMADDRKAAITSWLSNRLGDAKVVAEYPTAVYLLSGQHTEPYLFPPEEGPRRHLQRLLDSMQAAHGYRAAYVLDAGGNVVADGTGSPPLEPACRASVARVLSSGCPEVDLHAHADGLPMLAITAPVRADDRIVGAVLLSADPGRWLYPLLLSEPIFTRTGESLLARRFGDEVEFLSRLRHRSARPLSFRLPANAAPLAAVAAIRGEEGFKQYVDYRGVRVFGATRRIPDTGWGLVVKVDEDEALAGFRRSVRDTALALAGLLVALAGFGFGAWRTRAASHRAQLGESEARFALLRDHANDAILFASRDGVILDVNRKAEQLYVRRREDLLGLPFDDLRAPEERAALRDQLDALGRDEQIVFEAVHRRPDGTRFPVEVSTRVADLAGQDVLVSIVRDITERKRAEERITTLNRLLRTISEVNQLIVRERDRDRLLAEACRIMVEHGGFRMAWIGFTDETTGTVVPATWAGFDEGYLGSVTIRFDDTPLGRGPTGAAIREGRAVVADDWETDERLMPWREAARARGYRSSASFPLSAGGKVTGALSVYAAEAAAFDAEVTDLLGELAGDIVLALKTMDTEARRQAAEHALRDAEERFRIAAETSNDVVYEWDLKQSVQWFGNIDEMLGYGTGEFPRTLDGWAASVHPDDVERAMAAVRAHLEKQVPYAIEYRVRKKNGTYRWWTARGAAARTPDGEPVRWVGTITDITERKRDEEALRESEARYRTLVENIPQKIFMKDRNFRFVSINERFAHDLGIRPEEAVGKADADFFPPELAAKYHEDDVRILETGKTEVLEERYLQEGRETWVSTIKTPVRDTNGEIVGVLGVFWDVTERKRAEEEIRRLNAELEERVRQRTAQLEAVNKELEAFSYSVSHDLRAPLRAIDGFSRIVADDYGDRLDDEGKRQLEVIRANTQKMGRLIDDLLAFSRAGRAELHRVRIEMGSLVHAVFSEVVPDPEERNRIDLTVGKLPSAWVDPALIRQVWVNLLSNAVKFSRPRPRAEIEVSASRQDNRTVYHVKDNGVGFDMKYVDKLFGVFQRLHSSREFEGTGVGLALVQRIVHRHGGEVWAEGVVDGGATFHFALPQEESHEQR